MFGERCTLCGGKLDSKKICKECGLNNSKSEKYYKINRSSCDGLPMTHVHEEQEVSKPVKKPEQKKVKYEKAAESAKPKESPRTYGRVDRTRIPETFNRNPKQKKGSWAAKLVTAFVFLSVAGTIIGSLAEIGFDGDIFSDSDSYERQDPYETLYELGDEIPVNGSDEEFELPAGKYIVGVHLPEGDYAADIAGEYDAIRVEDSEHSIYLYEYPAMEGENYLGDLRLFDGALVEVLADDPVLFTTENAQELSGMENPLKKSYEFSGDTEKTAGVDIEAGAYDLKVLEGWGQVNVQVPGKTEETEDTEETDDFQLDYGFTAGMEYRNILLPEGAKLVLTDDLEDTDERLRISLTPSPRIASTDYTQTFENYYR